MMLLQTSSRDKVSHWLIYNHLAIWWKYIIIINIKNEWFSRMSELDQVLSYPKFRITQPCEQEINAVRQTRALSSLCASCCVLQYVKNGTLTVVTTNVTLI
jgi:hypothetical protein